MYGEIPQQEVETKSPLLEEGGIYIISRFRVSNAKSGYRPVDSPYMVEFTLHTTISAAKTDLLAFPQYAYKITPIDALATHAGDTKNFLGMLLAIKLVPFCFLLSFSANTVTCTDTIGVLVEVSEAYRVRLPNKPIPILTRHIVLRDLRS
jgi:replication factor A1